MSDTETQTLEALAEKILEDGVIDADEVSEIRERLYRDGVIDREEVDFLFKLNDATATEDNDPGWQLLFVDAISDHLLNDKDSPGVVDEAEAAYLMSKIQGDGKVCENELALLVNICAKAEGGCPPDLAKFILNNAKKAIIADGIIDSNEVEMMKTIVFGSGGAGGAHVDRAEADFLFDVNDATTANSGHASSWQPFFVEAISRHLLGDEISPNEVDQDEASWLIGRIEGDGDYDANERALLAEIGRSGVKIPDGLKFKIDLLDG